MTVSGNYVGDGIPYPEAWSTHTIVQQGWECPKCHNVMAPFMPHCSFCYAAAINPVVAPIPINQVPSITVIKREENIDSEHFIDSEHLNPPQGLKC